VIHNGFKLRFFIYRASLCNVSLDDKVLSTESTYDHISSIFSLVEGMTLNFLSFNCSCSIIFVKCKILYITHTLGKNLKLFFAAVLNCYTFLNSSSVIFSLISPKYCRPTLSVDIIGSSQEWHVRAEHTKSKSKFKILRLELLALTNR